MSPRGGDGVPGHECVSTTVQSYAKRDAVAAARQSRTFTVLEGGKPHRIRTGT